MSSDTVCIEGKMLEQIRDGHIQAYLTDILLDFKIIREHGEGVYFWGVRGNGCGSDILVADDLREMMRRWEKPIPGGRGKFMWEYPLSWAWAHMEQDVSFAQCYRILVTKSDEQAGRHEGKFEPMTKDEIRQWLSNLEAACVKGEL